MKIGIELNEGASMHDAIIDCARSFSEGYGAGTLTRGDGVDGYEADDYLGFWTSIPDEQIKFDLIIEIPEGRGGQLHRAYIAGIIRSKAQEYKEN